LYVKFAEICSKQIDCSGKQFGTMKSHKYLMKVNTLWWRNSVWLMVFCVFTQNQTHFPSWVCSYDSTVFSGADFDKPVWNLIPTSAT